MHHISNTTDRLVLKNGKITRILKVIYKKRSADIYSYNEDDTSRCRYLYTGLYGIYVCFPGEDLPMGFSGKQECECLSKCKKMDFFASHIITDDEKNIIVGKYPKFKYILNKWTGTLADVMDVLVMWKEHPEIELILSAGYLKLAKNKSFYKLSKPKKKEVLQFLKNCKNKDITLKEIFTRIKYKLSTEQYSEYAKFCSRYGCRYDYPTVEYIKSHSDNLRLKYEYADYKKMLNDLPHNKDDPYWKYPKDFVKAHNKILEEWNRTQELIKELKQEKSLKARAPKYYSAVKKYLTTKKIVNGYAIYIPEDVKDIALQAKALHQCLISCDYITQVIENRCILVFIKKDDKPVATVQLFSGGKIGQFYANELDRKNCLPANDVKSAFGEWLKENKSVFVNKTGKKKTAVV